MYSEEALARVELAAAREKEREEVGLSLRDTRSRVKKCDRLKKRTKTKNVRSGRLKRHLEQSEALSHEAATKAARSELLLQEEPGCLEAEGTERTYRFKQEDIAAAVPTANAQQYFDLKLETFGPYSISYSRNGRNIVLGGGRGHIATFDWRTKKLGCEFHVRETVRDVQYLHNEMMFAVAQKRHLFVYDHTGMELHCLKKHRDVNKLTFLPYHFLLVSADDRGSLRYLDTSIGREVTEHRTRMGSLRTIAHNPYNAVVHLGHQNGTVSLWSPNMHTPLVKMLCHRGPITGIAIDSGGWCMATVAMDARLKIWDLRSTYRELQSYYTYRPAVSVAVSQRGLLALGRGQVVEVWRDVMGEGGGVEEKQKGPYLTHRLKGEANGVEFCPFEDCLGIGHSNGFTSIIVPGAGEANFDALEVNPYQTKKQRQESEVKQLLEKIPSELISLNPDQINKVSRSNSIIGAGGKESEVEEAGETKKLKKEKKKKARGKDTLIKHLHQRQTARDEKNRELKRQKQRHSRGRKVAVDEQEREEEKDELEGREGVGEGEESDGEGLSSDIEMDPPTTGDILDRFR